MAKDEQATRSAAQIAVRLDADLVHWLRRRSEESRRPMTDEIAYLLGPVFFSDMQEPLLAAGEKDELGRTLEDYDRDEALRRAAARLLARKGRDEETKADRFEAVKSARQKAGPKTK